MNKEAIEYLTKDVVFWDNEGSGRIAQIPRADYDQALVILKEQPPASEFIKECRELRKKGATDEQWEYAEKLSEACVEIVRLEAQLKAKDELLFAYESVRAPKQSPAGDSTKVIRQWIKDRHYLDNAHSLPDFILLANRLLDTCARLDRSEARQKELLNACEKVQDWLDTSSLQQVLVHYTEDKRKHALIMGIASHLERLEAAIKANKEGGE